MTPAITLLRKQKVPHDVLSYEHEPLAASYGVEAAEKLSLDADAVFKTLVLESETKTLVVALVPVKHKVSEKKLANIVGAKKIKMAAPETVTKSTGYVLGGVSPIAQKRRLRTVIHTSAQAQSTLYVSAGKRGLEIAITPDTLATLTDATWAEITAD
ncbi:Cys-tRNA(Pro) deacylase [Alteromonas sp. A079]|uniref:Cys-tRNA(Pro) deacylase n=1 Tax=Alteromonas sp. A079 TaxID=3410268 RepID=UPI003BA3D0AC